MFLPPLFGVTARVLRSDWMSRSECRLLASTSVFTAAILDSDLEALTELFERSNRLVGVCSVSPTVLGLDLLLGVFKIDFGFTGVCFGCTGVDTGLDFVLLFGVFKIDFGFTGVCFGPDGVDTGLDFALLFGVFKIDLGFTGVCFGGDGVDTGLDLSLLECFLVGVAWPQSSSGLDCALRFEGRFAADSVSTPSAQNMI